jgi:rhodanese-related sulfurtransferase
MGMASVLGRFSTKGLIGRCFCCGSTACYLSLLLLLAVPLAGLNAWLNPHRPSFSQPSPEFSFITVSGLQALQREGDFLLLDARSPQQFASGHITGALPLYPGDFDDALVDVIEAWEPGQTIVIYCDDALCGSSAVVARRLRDEVELEPIYLLEGGWDRWIESSSQDVQAPQRGGAP